MDKTINSDQYVQDKAEKGSLTKLILTYVRQWRQNQRTRKVLSEMPDHLLEDIGVTRDQANRESRRPFWQYK
ncbi:DUF1127 domain-containing protein [Vibrio barjaei]|jgi:uncharacterized protein YjiS (DUF1127 family)|uniref:DUF1127 domain-containing protein n=1 Tax=Vibrio barjaei TaxID=1676683 RepID=A0ABW7IMP0_9VIBR|nr:DUF1127 domain-containing protein [Vibrio barjaei]MCG9785947.1 DUF1127 domain-containing protein [Vibrio mediterranei]MCY9869497.1 DUF1127 domain-containing protein [Vibrio barjaei]